MKIKLKEITIRELVKGYKDNNEDGVIGHNGKLDIRPPYQREFVYTGEQRDSVINTIIKNFPLNIMYWSVKDDGNFEVIDGQQRTISISQFVEGDFSFNERYFHNQQADEKEKFLNYKLTVYLCKGEDSEKLDWFKIINIAGAKLTDQELRNAVYSGSWVTDAKRYFSKNGCAAYGIGSDYLNGEVNRQIYLETAIKWISKNKIEDYMGKHQNDADAKKLLLYFKKVIAWIETVFAVYRAEMKGLAWGEFYNKFKDNEFDSDALELETSKLMEDEEIGNKRGIYEYLLTREKKHLNLRVFSKKQKREAYQKQDGIYPVCNKKFKIEDMAGDHIIAWVDGGKTIDENCQMLCKKDNLRKGAD